MRPHLILTIFSCSVIGIIAIIFIYNLQPPVFSSNNQISIEIPQKSSFSEIAEKLNQSELIRSKTAFKIYSLLAGRAHLFKPGKYFFPSANESGLSAPELTKILVAGPKEIPIIIYPGMTLKEIDERLANSGIIQKNELLNFDANSLKNNYPWLPFKNNLKNTLEGFLLPDTYYFFPVTGPDLTIQKILDNFELRALPFLNGNVNILKTLTLASLLEKEIPDNNEKRIAAGILEKRLSVGMPLQIDATIIYIKCEGRFLNCPALSKEDYKIDSPYNTYLSKGLPIAPISNPSLETIKAAMKPIKTNYWYYLSDPKTKKTIFSETLDKHNQNRVKYLNR